MGAPKVLLSAVEKNLAVMVDSLAEWGFPRCHFELQIVAKDIDRENIVDKRFKNNTPGPDCINSFMKQSNLKKRMASNIKQSRAVIEENLTNTFFYCLEQVYEKINKFDGT